MLEVSLKKRICQCPESWAECTPEQVPVFLLARRIPAEMRDRVVYESLVQAFLGLTEKEWRKLVLSIEQWKKIKTLTAWIFETALPEKPFDFFKFEGIWYYLPEPNFKNTSAIEVSLANMAYVEFAHPEKPDLSAIDRLIAILCRPQRADLEAFQASEQWNGDLRQPFNQNRAELTAKVFVNLPFAIKVAFLTYFEQMNTAFLADFSEMFGTEKEKEPRYAKGLGWLMILKNVAKSGIWGNFETVCRQPARTVWAFMLDDTLDSRQQQEELEKQYENAKSNR